MTRQRARLRDFRQPASRRPGISPGRRFVLVLAVSLALLVCFAAFAEADPSSNPIVVATVYTSSGVSSDSVSLAELQAQGCPLYSAQTMNELGQGGAFVPADLPPSGPQTGTWALATILGCLQKPIPLAAVHGVTVMRSDGSPQVAPDSELTPADLRAPSDFSNTAEAPVIEDHGSSIQYDRPFRGNHAHAQPDRDLLDEVQQSQDGQPSPITIEVFEGNVLTVTARTAQTTVSAGDTVNFTETVSPPHQSGLTYSWNFGGGAPNSTASSPSVTFATPGTYEVTLQVTDAPGGGGGSSLQMTVNPSGGAPSSGQGSPHNGNGTNPKAKSPTGPEHSGGTHPGGAPRSKDSATGGAAPVGSHPDNTNTNTNTNTTPAASTIGSPTGTAGSSTVPDSRSGHHGTSTAAPHSSVPVNAPTANRKTPAAHAPVVAGRLISYVTPLPESASPLVHSVPAPVPTAPAVRRAIRGSLVPALSGGLGVVLLFGLGAARELGGRRHWRALRVGG